MSSSSPSPLSSSSPASSYSSVFTFVTIVIITSISIRLIRTIVIISWTKVLVGEMGKVVRRGCVRPTLIPEHNPLPEMSPPYTPKRSRSALNRGVWAPSCSPAGRGSHSDKVSSKSKFGLILDGTLIENSWRASF